MQIRPSASLIIAFALITSACSASMRTPDIKPNPNPTKRYEITMDINNAPGPFDSVNGFVLYQVDNEECLPVEPFSGVRHALQKNMSVVLRRTGNVYKGTFYSDQWNDENYYGKGLCHWSVNTISVNIKIRKVIFTLGNVLEALQPQKPLVTYFATASYNDPKEEGGNTGTTRTPAVIANPHDFFSGTLVVKEDSR